MPLASHRNMPSRNVALLLGLAVTALGAAVLAGWALHIPTLESVLPGLASMKANTATGMLLCGAALALLSRETSGRPIRLATKMMAVTVIVLGALTLAEYIFGWNLGIDQWLFRDVVGAVETSSPGRMGPPSAFCFVLTGLALAMASQPVAMRLRRPVLSALSAVIVLIGGLTSLGYFSGVWLGWHFWNYAGMAIHTSMGFLLLGFALLLVVRSEGGLTWSLDSLTTGGFLIGIAALLAAAVGAYQFTSQLQRADTRVSHTQEVLKGIQALQAGVADLESQQRGFIITGDGRLLEQRGQTDAATQKDLGDLRRLTADNPHQQSRLDQLEPLIAQRFEWGDQTIAARRQQGFPDAQRMIATGTGIVLSGKIYGLLQEMEDEEYALLHQRQHQTDTISTETFLILPLGMLLSLTILSLGLFLLNGDMRERKQAEGALRANEERYRALFEHAPYGILIADPESCYIDANASVCRMLGYTHDELVGLYASEIVAPAEIQHIAPALSVIHAKSDYRREWQLRRKDGSVFAADVMATVMPDGNLLGMICDITERNRNEESRAQLAAIVESSEDAIIGKDLNSVVTSWNPAATKLFGYTAGEMVGHSILLLIPPDHQQEETQILSRIERGESLERLETVRKRKDGQLIDVSITVSPIRDAANKVVGASKIAREITERKKLEEQLRQSQKLEAIGQLTGGVAHDFNNLLGVILGNLDLLERLVADNAAAVRRVQTAQKAATRGADLTKRLLAFSSRQQLNPVPTSLEASIQNIVEMASRVLGPEIKIKTSFDKSVPPVLVDSAGLENVLLNLAVNARDAMPKGGSITISTQLSELEESYPPVKAEQIKQGRYARITVSDTGQGMSSETLQRVFEPFFTTKPRGKGTGLGLSMIYGFVKQSGGTIRIYSELGIGTAVSFFLPLAEGVPLPSQESPGKQLPAKAGGTVLVVDDETELLEIAAGYAEDLGYRVLQATDGASALAVVAREPGIELLITDVLMPGGLNGVELAAKVSQLIPGVKVIYSSGFPSDALAERNGTKVDGLLLSKPYQRSEFVAFVRRAMGSDLGGEA